MRFTEGIIYFGVYAVFVLILTLIYVAFFEKTLKAKMRQREDSQREKARNTLKKPAVRDYDKEPIIVKNDYKIKIAFITTAIFIPLSLFLIFTNIEPQADSFDEHIRKAALATGVIGMLGSTYFSAVLFFENRKKISTRGYTATICSTTLTGQILNFLKLRRIKFGLSLTMIYKLAMVFTLPKARRKTTHLAVKILMKNTKTLWLFR